MKGVESGSFHDTLHSSMIATRNRNTYTLVTHTLDREQKRKKSLLALKKGPRSSGVNVFGFGSLAEKKRNKPVAKVRDCERHVAPSEKDQSRRRYNIDNRPKTWLFIGVKRARREFGRARDIKSASPSCAEAVFADVVRFQRRRASTRRRRRRLSKPGFFTPLRRNNCKLGSSLGREINWNLLRSGSGRGEEKEGKEI